MSAESGGYAPSGMAPANFDFTSAIASTAEFVPIPGRGFNVSVYGTFVGTVILEKKIAGVWVPKWPFTVFQISEPRTFTDDDPEHGVSYRFCCPAYTSGTISTRISQ